MPKLLILYDLIGVLPLYAFSNFGIFRNIAVLLISGLLGKSDTNEFSLAGLGTTEVKEKFKILKYILGAFMLRRTKAKLIEYGTLVLPSLTEITLLVSSPF